MTISSIYKRPWLSLVICLAVIIALAMGTDRLQFRGDYRIFFDANNTQVLEYNYIESVYGKTDNISIIIAPNNNNVFSARYLQLIQNMTSEAWKLPFVTRVESLANYQHTSVVGDELNIIDLLPLLESGATFSDREIQSAKSIALGEPSLVNRLVSQDGGSSQIVITVNLPEDGDQTEDTNRLAASVQGMVDQVAQSHPNVRFYISGMAAMTNAFVKVSQQDMGTLMPAMLLVLILVLWALLRSVFSVISVVLIVVLSIIGTLGAAGWAGMYMSMATANLPIFIITLAVADSVHVLASTHLGMESGLSRKDAVISAIKSNMMALSITSATTAIGFLTFNMSEVPPIRDLGNMVAVGVLIAYVLSIVLLPLLVIILPIGMRTQKSGFGISEKWTDFIVDRRNAILMITSITVIISFAFALKNQVNDIPTEYFDKSVEFRQAAEFSDRHLSGVNSIEVVIDTGNENGITDPTFLKTVDDFTFWLRSHDDVRQVYTLSDTFRRLNRDMNTGDNTFYSIPSDPEIASQYFLLYEMSLPYGFNLDNQVDLKKKSFRLVISMSNIGSDEILALETGIRSWFSRNGSNYELYIGSPSLMFAHIGDRNMKSLLIGTAGALLLISLLVGFFLRSLQSMWISLLTNLMPIVIGFGIFALYSAQIDLGVSVVACICVGIVVDDTVHFLTRYYTLRNSGYTAEAAIRGAMSKVGRALVVTTVVLICGFMVLSLSNYTSNSNMGILTSIIIGFALIVDLVFLPSLILLIDRKGRDVHLYDPSVMNTQLDP